MKKIAPITLAALLLGAVAVGAEQPTNVEGTQLLVNEKAFIEVKGKITAVNDLENARLFTVGEKDQLFNFYVDEKTLVFDQEGNEVELKIGDTVSLSIFANQAMILIYPPQYAPPVVIVEKDNSMSSAKVAQFDGNLLSDDGKLKLNLKEDSVIVNAQGEKVEAKYLKNYSTVVFYGPTTKSIPAQTSPQKIVVFPKLEDSYTEESPEIAQEISDIIGEDYKKVEGVIMVPLRLIAEELGYKVESTGKGAIISKGATSYTITRGEKAYGYNRALNYFEVAPALLEDHKTYVQYDLALQLLN